MRPFFSPLLPFLLLNLSLSAVLGAQSSSETSFSEAEERIFAELSAWLKMNAAPIILEPILLEDFDGSRDWSPELVEGDAQGMRIKLAFREGAPALLEDAELSLLEAGAQKTRRALGIRVDCLIPGEYEISLSPSSPLAIPLGSDSLALWVQGSNRGDELFLDLQNEEGKSAGWLSMGRLNFAGWKRLQISLPPVLRRPGMKISAFRLRLDPLSQSANPAYSYFDLLSAGREGRP